jgi:hypothetical protein
MDRMYVHSTHYENNIIVTHHAPATPPPARPGAAFWDIVLKILSALNPLQLLKMFFIP